jgi:hypothetical protein
MPENAPKVKGYFIGTLQISNNCERSVTNHKACCAMIFILDNLIIIYNLIDK